MMKRFRSLLLSIMVLLWTAGAAHAQNAIQPKIVLQQGHTSLITAAAWTLNGKHLITGSTDGQILIWDLVGNIVEKIYLGDPDRIIVVENIELSSDGKSIKIDSLLFKNMYDNGAIDSRIWYLSHRYRFGDPTISEISSRVDWAEIYQPSFLQHSEALIRKLLAREDWPISSLGWRLSTRGDTPSIISPDGSRAFALTGVFRSNEEDGYTRLKRTAEFNEKRAKSFEAQYEASNKGLPIPKTPTIFDAPASGKNGPPIFSPDGSLLAWLENMSENDAGEIRLRMLDLVQGRRFNPLRIAAENNGAEIKWEDEGSLTISGDQHMIVVNIDPKSGQLAQSNTESALPSAEIPRCPNPSQSVAGKSKGLCRGYADLVEVRTFDSEDYLCMAGVTQTEFWKPARVISSNDFRDILVQSESGYTQWLVASATDVTAGATQRSCPDLLSFNHVLGGIGFHPNHPLLWVEGKGGVIDFYGRSHSLRESRRRPQLDKPLLSLHRLPGGYFFVVDGEGRYDTNLPADSNAIRWYMRDAPFQSLGPQTFLRDYYEPNLYQRLISCHAADDCDKVFKPLRPMASINRVLPTVKITGVTPTNVEGEVFLEYVLTEGVNPAAANGKTKSGLYNPRIFLNGRFVAHYPDDPDARPKNLDEWRKLNDVNDPAFKGSINYSQQVIIPTTPDTAELDFSVYAFNEDRIKSETAHFRWSRPDTIRERNPKRAFIVNIGIDDYDDDNLDLNYAVADARLMSERFKDIPGYETRRLVLAGEVGEDGKRIKVSDSVIRNSLGMLMTDLNRQFYLDELSKEGIDASMLSKATPDDIIIITFSGHGWANKQGDFFLIPSNGFWETGSESPHPASVVSMDDLTMLLRSTRAADISLIIDACHSAASVDNGRFKPGPMGDSGLGQLAYDKGIRILTATQADDVAMEDGGLRHGLLTYALVGDDGGGITSSGGEADLDKNGLIMMDEWLEYGVRHLPKLGEDNRVSDTASNNDSAFYFPNRTVKRRRPIQKPSLFDFGADSKVVLRRIAR